MGNYNNEIFSIPSASVDSGWHHISWAFLRPGDGKFFTNLDQRSKLQLYAYQNGNGWRPNQRPGIFEQWSKKRIKFEKKKYQCYI